MSDSMEVTVEEREPKGSYAESREKQAEFEEDVREEKGDWQDAVDESSRARSRRSPRNLPAPARDVKRGAVRVGTSGWSYQDWRGVVYPRALPQRSWFACYAELFDTVELNNTFYRLPPVETVEMWARQAPPGFLYAVKLGAFGSHRMKLRDAAVVAEEPPRPRRTPRAVGVARRWCSCRLAGSGTSSASPSSSTRCPSGMRWAVELREPTWLHDDVYDVLRRHGAALCIHDLLPDHPWIRTADWTYLRFHGPRALEQKYVGRYGGRRLWRVADRVDAWLDEGCDVFAYFNNDYNGDAVRDAQWFRDRLTRTRRVDYSETARSPPLTASATIVAATSRSFRFVCCEACLSISNASSASHWWSRIRMPLACSITARDSRAVRSCSLRVRAARVGLGVGEGGSGMRDEHRRDLLVVGERVRRCANTG